jgi:glycosyltransferase involved in cell wall biosynthesis
MFADRIGWPEYDTDFYRVGTAMEELSIQRADALMACSANIADYTAERHGVERSEIDVVHCGVDARAFTPTAGDRNGGPPTILFAGNFAENKGAITVFEAALRLRSRHPGLRLQMIGKENSLSDALADRAREENAEDAIDVVGFVGDRDGVASYHRAADVFCSVARHEVGVANVYIEAMAAGSPVVASTTGGAPEAVIDGETGLLVEFGDVDATAEALDRILSDRALAARMGEAGRRRVDEYFAMDRYVDRVLATYDRAIARSRDRHAIAEKAAAGGSW